MSTKTSLKKIAVIAAMALTLGGFTAVTANAANLDVLSSVTSDTAAIGASTSTVLTIDGSATIPDTTVLSFSGSGIGTWALTGLNKVSAGATTGTTAAGTTLTKTSGSAQASAVLTVTPTSGSGHIIVKDSNNYTVLDILIGASTVSTNDNPFVVNDFPTNTGVTAGTPSTLGTAAASISVTKAVGSSTDTVTISATSDTLAKALSGNYRYVQVTNSTIKSAAGWTLDGSANVATVAAAPQSGAINGTTVVVNAATSGQTITVKFWDKTTDDVTGFVTTVLLQTITITTSTYAGLNPSLSTAVLNGVDGTTIGGSSSTSGVVSTPSTGAGFSAEQSVLAPATLGGVGGNTSIAGTAKAVIKVNLNSITALGTSTPLLGTLPAVGAKIEGPGTLSIGLNPNDDGSTGRYLTLTAAPANEFFINVFSDGTSGVGTISILVGGSVWKTKTVTFYGAATKLTATQNHKVLQAGVATGSICTSATNCDGTSIAESYVVQVVASDANNMPVPYVSYTAPATVDGVVVTSSSKVFAADSAGATWFDVRTASDAASGKTGTVSYKSGTLVTGTLSFAIGGEVSTLTTSLGSSANTEVGGKNTLTITAKDAAGNAPYDQDLDSTLASNVALVSGTSAATSGLPSGADAFAMLGGTASASFFNPVTPGEVTIAGKIGGVATSLTYSVSNSAINAAADAAAEATDAANAATDAANAAAEAADAATAAAQDAADAVAALSAQVTAMISALKKQLIALTNLVIKIQKKVRA